MTENEIRQSVVDAAMSHVDAANGNAEHREILRIYNSLGDDVPRGHKMTTRDPWCAATVSAIIIETGNTDIAPVECSCGQLIRKAKEMGIWVEADNHVPQPADFLFYDWDDDGKGECTGDPEHVGTVVRVSGGKITVMEGNMRGNQAGTHPVPINGKYIRGYICPDYASKATVPAPTPAAMGEYVVQKGDTLSSIAKRFLHDPMRYKELAEINGIKNPDIIHPGQKLLIPADLGFEPGDKVRVRSGAPVYGKSYKFHGWVYDKPLFVRKVDGNCVTITTDLNQTANTGKVDAKYLIHA